MYKIEGVDDIHTTSMSKNETANRVVSPTARLFANAECTDSSVGDFSMIGDNSRVRRSILADHVRIDRNNLVLGCTMGRKSYTGPFDMLFHAAIGSFTSISYGVTIGPPEHDYHKTTCHPFIYDSYYGIADKEACLRNDKFDKNITIGNDVWIGANVTILRGVNIGDGVVVGANALVNKNAPPYAVIAGCPAKIIGFRFPPEVIEKLLKIQWWKWTDEKIKQNLAFFQSEPTLKTLSTII